MRIFNTSGPCDPVKHYTAMREALVAKGQALVAQGHYFTIFAPRQAGKTTYFQLLLRQLAIAGYTPIWISFEGLKTLPRARFYQALHHHLQREFAKYGIHSEQTILDQFDVQLYLEQVSIQAQAIVLVIDEFEDIPDVVLSELMHSFCALYQKREYHKLHSLVLVGVSTVAELVLSLASPFNVVDELRIPYFTFGQVQELIGQHIAETSPVFDPTVVKAIYENTNIFPPTARRRELHRSSFWPWTHRYSDFISPAKVHYHYSRKGLDFYRKLCYTYESNFLFLLGTLAALPLCHIW